MTLLGAANKAANNDLTLYEQRKVDGLCTRCGKPATDDSQLCKPHRAAQLASQRKHDKRTRARRRKAGRCTRCERKATEGELCTVHRVKRLASKSLAANKTANKVSAIGERYERIRARTVVGDDGRVRYHGQERRGRQTVASLDEQDIDTAVMELLKAKDGLRIARSTASKSAPRIQQREAVIAAWSMGHVAIRLLFDGLVRLGSDEDVQDFIEVLQRQVEDYDYEGENE